MGGFRRSRVADEQGVGVAYELAGDGDVDGRLLLVPRNHPHLRMQSQEVARTVMHGQLSSELVHEVDA